MKPLYTQEEFNQTKTTDKLPCECYQCGNKFYKLKRVIQAVLRNDSGHNGKYCSIICTSNAKKLKKIVNCANCKKSFEKLPNQIKKTKSGNHFCSRSCAATYNNKHKSFGTRRSKLEKYIEEQLSSLYPDLDIHFNHKDAIGSELDIYVPSLNIAFELNGIFHYEPIFGNDKLRKIQENDISKSKACIDAKIDLCIIDTSGQKYVKPSTSQKYLDIITKIINERMLIS